MYTTRKNSGSHLTETTYPTATFEERDRAFLRASDECCQLAGAAQKITYAKSKLNWMHLSREQRGPHDDWDQVRSLVKNGQIVGSHTMTHPNMAYVSNPKPSVSSGVSKQRLETELGQTVTHFSYPCPAMSPHWTRERSNRAAVADIDGCYHKLR